MEPFRTSHRTQRYSLDRERRSRRSQADRTAFRPSFSAVWSSPSARARNTCALAGFGAGAVIRDDLAEWDYGAYEGITTKEILAARPGWQLFRDGCPNGETAADVGARADAVIQALRQAASTILIFSSSHFLRVLAARWLGLPPQGGVFFLTRYHKHQRARLRARPDRTGHPPVESEIEPLTGFTEFDSRQQIPSAVRLSFSAPMFRVVNIGVTTSG